MTMARLLMVMLFCQSLCMAEVRPPYTDYCQMLARDIQGKAHGFLAGNLIYYVGGQTDAEWNVTEHETLGFTHPFFRDGRARGYGIAKTKYGTGNNKWGWDLWRETRIAYGSVVIDGKRYPYPKPKEMIWRPDRHICRYELDGVTIEENKFISTDDVLCSIIKSTKPVTLEFDGQSFVSTYMIPTFDGDQPNTPMMRKRTATARFDRLNNAIHIVEGGTAVVKPDWGEPAIEGKMMYDGMSVVLSASADLSRSHTIRRDKQGRQVYTLTARCTPDRPLVLAFAMGDEYAPTIKRVKALLADPQAALAAKTKYINELLNYQIPYFRCSDEGVVKTYYYLWSLYFMYFIDVGKGWECYPHTQTAVNNFLGLHNFDSAAYVRMGSWVADKKNYGYGNLLSWKAVVPFKNENNLLPDNFGIAWWSPVRMCFEWAAEGARQMYEHSGDREFLKNAYAFLKELYWSGGPDWCSGVGINLLDDLMEMARGLGAESDIGHWQSMREPLVKEFLKYWEIDIPHYYGETSLWKDIFHLASMMYYGMSDQWVDVFVRDWVMNTETGFMGPVPLDIRPPDCIENGVFAVSSLSTYLATEGMFRHHRDAEAVHCLLGHIKGMVRDYGYPVAPECWDPDYKPWGDLYYNWDGAMVLPMIKRLAGIQYSLIDNEFIVCDHLPRHWDYIKTMVPVVTKGKTNWVKVEIGRKERNGKVEKTICVDGNPLKKLIIQPWLQDRALITANRSFKWNAPRGHIGYLFDKSPQARIRLELGENHYDFPLLVYVAPMLRDFVGSLDVELIGLMQGSQVYYTCDGTEPTESSLRYANPVTIDKTTTFTVRAFAKDYSPGPIKTITYNKVVPRQPEKPANLENGLNYRFYEGKWKKLPAFASLKPAKSGSVPRFDISVSPKDDQFAIVFTGYVKVPKDGIYTFHTRSNDGSRIYIGDKLVVDLDVWREGLLYDPLDELGSIGLKAGLHPIKVEFFQHSGRKVLDVSYEGPGLPKQPIVPSVLFH